jgi:tetratricopeptide (TPR) repeat protein
MLFRWFKKSKPAEVKGFIKYYGIEDFWLNTLTEKQREEVKIRYGKGLNTDSNSIDQIEIESTSMPLYSFLIIMAEGISDIQMKDRIISWAIEEVEKQSDVIEKHYTYMGGWKIYKQIAKENTSYYSKYIELLIKDCEIHDQFNKQYFKEYGVLPFYPSFKELALAYERAGEIEKAIEISRMALKKNVKEKTSFERRIAKLEKKLHNR